MKSEDESDEEVQSQPFRSTMSGRSVKPVQRFQVEGRPPAAETAGDWETKPEVEDESVEEGQSQPVRTTTSGRSVKPVQRLQVDGRPLADERTGNDGETNPEVEESKVKNKVSRDKAAQLRRSGEFKWVALMRDSLSVGRIYLGL
jgi:hypothetical protein